MMSKTTLLLFVACGVLSSVNATAWTQSGGGGGGGHTHGAGGGSMINNMGQDGWGTGWGLGGLFGGQAGGQFGGQTGGQFGGQFSGQTGGQLVTQGVPQTVTKVPTAAQPRRMAPTSSGTRAKGGVNVSCSRSAPCNPWAYVGGTAGKDKAISDTQLTLHRGSHKKGPQLHSYFKADGSGALARTGIDAKTGNDGSLNLNILNKGRQG